MKVFLASTSQDLVDYRRVVDDTILRLSHDSVAMERFGSLPGQPIMECEHKARECDVILCIVAHRYGFIPDRGRGSVTRREVEAAKAAGKAVLAWIIAEDHPWTQPREQDLLADSNVLADPVRVADVLEGVRELSAFKTWLRANFTCETYTTPDDLGRKVAIAMRDYAANRAQLRVRPPPRGEVRVVHALQPAPHFHGRDAVVKPLIDWVSDVASPIRVWALVAAGGTGKTAVAERVIREMNPGEANVLVWSFYETPDTDAFLSECNDLFLGEDHGPTGGRLERLERGLRDGRPHLIVLDGLERVQEEAGSDRVRGELSDHALKLLLRALAAGLGRARALVTSRFPLTDLQDWRDHGYSETYLDDLSSQAAITVLRGWGVTGDDVDLRAAASQVGNHALSVAVIGSYLRSFANGSIDAVTEFDLAAVTGADPKAAKLSRVLAFYAKKLPAIERELLARLSIFPRAITLELLAALADAGGDVAGLLAKNKPYLLGSLYNLRDRGLTFAYKAEDGITWTAHPFLRENFRTLLGCPPERVFEVAAGSLRAGLEERPGTKPVEPAVLDRYERLIEVTRLSGREQEAFDLYRYGLGGYPHLAWVLGEYQRGFRILAAFSASGRPEDLAPTLRLDERAVMGSNLSAFSEKVGRLEEAWSLRLVQNQWRKSIGDGEELSMALANSAYLAIARGRLADALEFATLSEAAGFPHMFWLKKKAYAAHGIIAHFLGDITSARAAFREATVIEEDRLISFRASLHIRHLLDLGELTEARYCCNYATKVAYKNKWNDELPWFHALHARLDLAEGHDPSAHLDEVRTWTSKTGEIQYIIEAHLSTARHFLITGDFQAAMSEAEAGILHAVACGYGLLRIELLVTLARIWLAWPDPSRATRAALNALDLATNPECGYAWGEADAAQAWGEACFANNEESLAHGAFTHALNVRQRIAHPRVSETQEWLTRVG